MNVFVTRMDRANTGVILDTTVANNTVSGAREIVRNQAARVDDAINWWGESWGQRNDVVVAINGDFFNTTTGVITGGQVQGGGHIKRYANFGGYSGIGFRLDRSLFIGGCINNRNADQYFYFPATGKLDPVHQPQHAARHRRSLCSYTAQYNTTTLTNSSGSEVHRRDDDTGPAQLLDGHREADPPESRLDVDSV